jgi:hypothetical protein
MLRIRADLGLVHMHQPHWCIVIARKRRRTTTI